MSSWPSRDTPLTAEEQACLDECYLRLLKNGLVMLRNGLRSRRVEWAHELSEYLHEIPGLIGSSSRFGHEYHWHVFRKFYSEWVASHPEDGAMLHLKAMCEPVWQEIKTILKPGPAPPT